MWNHNCSRLWKLCIYKKQNYAIWNFCLEFSGGTCIICLQFSTCTFPRLHTYVKWKKDDQHLEVVIWCGDILCHYQSWCLKMVSSKDQFLCYRHFVSIQEHPKTAKQDKDKVQNKKKIYRLICIFPSKTVINTSHNITISKKIFFFNSEGELACTADKTSG